MYADSLHAGRPYQFESKSDSLVQRIWLTPIGNFQIRYSIWVGREGSSGFRVQGIATESATFKSSTEGDFWTYTSEDGSIDITVYESSALAIELFQRPIMLKRMMRIEPSNTAP